MSKDKDTSNIITMKDVTFMYSSVTRAVEQLNTENKPPLSDHPLEMHSFEIKILVSDDRYKKLKRAYKGAKNFPHAKELSAEEVKDAFDMEVDSDMVLIKFSQSALVGPANKRRESFPIKQIGIKAKVQDNAGNTIDQDTSVGNGTTGHFQFRPVEGKNGMYLYPHLLCITNLVEYVSAGSEDDMESLGLEELDETDVVAEGKKAADDAAIDDANDAAADAASADAEDEFEDELF